MTNASVLKQNVCHCIKENHGIALTRSISGKTEAVVVCNIMRGWNGKDLMLGMIVGTRS